MTDQELIERAKAGEILGNGSRQIAALLRELDKRPTAILIDADGNVDDAFSDARLLNYVKRGVIYKIEISQGERTWRFESVVNVE
jgi:ABC-type iron transport system FetAB ATPase subunit